MMQLKPKYFVLSLLICLIVGFAGGMYYIKSHDNSSQKITDLKAEAAANLQIAKGYEDQATKQKTINDSLLAARDQRLATYDSILNSINNVPEKFMPVRVAIRNNNLDQDIKFMSNRLPKSDPYH